MSDHPSPAASLVDALGALIARADMAHSSAAVIDVKQLRRLRDALSCVSTATGIHVKGQRASARKRYARSHRRILEAAERVLSRNPHIGERDLPGAVKTQLELQGRPLSEKTIREHLRDAEQNGGLHANVSGDG